MRLSTAGFVHRRRPFLIRALENTLVKLILSLEFYDEAGRQKIAIGERVRPTKPSGTAAHRGH